MVNYYYYLCCLLAGPWTYGRYVFLPYVGLIHFHLFYLQLPPLAPNIFCCFSNHQGAVFFFFLLLFLQSSVTQWRNDGGNFFLEYDQSNWLFYVRYYLEVSSSLLYVQELVHLLLSPTILSSPFSSSSTFRSSPTTSGPWSCL